MNPDRRHLLLTTTGAGLVAATIAARAEPRRPDSQASHITFGPDAGADVTARLQHTIEQAATERRAIYFAPGRYRIRGALRLPAGAKLIGPHGLATLDLAGAGAIAADNAADITLSGLTITGAANTRTAGNAALLSLSNCANVDVGDVSFDAAPRHAVKLWRCSGRIHLCRFDKIGDTAINSGNADSLEITRNRISDAGNNGIVVWRDEPGPDGTTVTHNHIDNVRSDAGGSGQNGNAINAFRAGNVIIMGNVIADCAYSAVRCNAASNAQIIANNCRGIGEVALYAEFAFEGAVIANNIVDGAATGIEVTNFKEGGRLATVQGNVIRNLFRREHEPVDKRGIAISVEADTVVSANTIENAATSGVSIGWGKWMRHVAATGNIIRNADIGIAVSALGPPGTVLLSNNIVAASRNGAVRLMDHNTPIGRPLEHANGASSPAILSGNLIS